MQKISFFLMFITCSAYGFNWERCYERNRGAGHYFLGTITSIYGTSEFVSSTGRCRAITDLEINAEEFFKINFEQIKVEASKGDGEYLTTYAELIGCEKGARKKLPKVFQRSFIDIFGADGGNSAKDAFKASTRVIYSNHTELRSCSHEK